MWAPWDADDLSPLLEEMTNEAASLWLALRLAVRAGEDTRELRKNYLACLDDVYAQRQKEHDAADH